MYANKAINNIKMNIENMIWILKGKNVLNKKTVIIEINIGENNSFTIACKISIFFNPFDIFPNPLIVPFILILSEFS